MNTIIVIYYVESFSKYIWALKRTQEMGLEKGQEDAALLSWVE
jgi:hypothetical protein